MQAAIGGRLKKTYMESGKMTFELLKGLELQPRRKLGSLLSSPYWTSVVKDEIVVKITVAQEKTLHKENMGSVLNLKKSIFTDYYFELIMVWCPPTPRKGGEENPLRRFDNLKVDSEESKLYKRRDPKGPVKDDELCVLKIDVPKTKLPWMALLKVSCLEGNELAHNPRHYAMKVVAVGTP